MPSSYIHTQPIVISVSQGKLISFSEKKYLYEQVPPHDVCYERFPKRASRRSCIQIIIHQFRKFSKYIETIMQLLQSQYARESPDQTSWTSKGQTRVSLKSCVSGSSCVFLLFLGWCTGYFKFQCGKIKQVLYSIGT